MKQKDFSIGDNLKRLRKAAGYSQNEVAAILGVPQSSISQYENKGIYPPIPVFLRLCYLYNITDVLKEFDRERLASSEITLLPGEVELIKKVRRLDDDNYYILTELLNTLLHVQDAGPKFVPLTEEEIEEILTGGDEDGGGEE